MKKCNKEILKKKIEKKKLNVRKAEEKNDKKLRNCLRREDNWRKKGCNTKWRPRSGKRAREVSKKKNRFEGH